MKKNNQRNKKVRGRITLALVCLVFGFIISFSYSQYKKEPKNLMTDQSLYEKENRYRDDLIQQMERNKELTEELSAKQEDIREYEKSFSNSEERSSSLVEEAKNLRLILGTISAQGEGIKVTLEDAEYDPTIMNPNDYIVHESHIFKVINELKISGAQAIAINGKRIHATSYIKCNGPVITVDNNQFPAPFTVEAIGDPNVLLPAIQLKGGVFDQLINDNIVVTLEESPLIQFDALHRET